MPFKSLIRRYGVIVSVCVAAFLIMFAAAATGRVSVPWNSPPTRDSSEYLATYRHEAGPQIVMVFVGASWCGASTYDGMHESVKGIKKELSETVRQNSWSFVAQGIALDWALENGMAFLNEFGEFDEVSIGYNWANRLLLHYAWERTTESPTVPMILVFRRHLTAPTTEELTAFYETTGEHLIFKVEGFGPIQQWAADGAPLPEGWDTYDIGINQP